MCLYSLNNIPLKGAYNFKAIFPACIFMSGYSKFFFVWFINVLIYNFHLLVITMYITIMILIKINWY